MSRKLKGSLWQMYIGGRGEMGVIGVIFRCSPFFVGKRDLIDLKFQIGRISTDRQIGFSIDKKTQLRVFKAQTFLNGTNPGPLFRSFLFFADNLYRFQRELTSDHLWPILKTIYALNLQLQSRNMGYFQVRYNSRVMNYDPKGFIRLATEWKIKGKYYLTTTNHSLRKSFKIF